MNWERGVKYLLIISVRLIKRSSYLENKGLHFINLYLSGISLLFGGDHG
jgi:hypothetical protein